MSADPISRLTALVGDLRAGPSTPPDALDAVRLAAANAVATGQGALATPPAATPPSIDDAVHDALSAVLAKVQQTTPQPQRVARRNVPTIVPAAPTGDPARFAGQAPRASYGPFVDALGRNAWIDVFDVLSLVGIQRTGTAAPAIYVAMTGATEAADHINLGAGSVWIATSALVAGAPANTYVGLRITSGTIAFGGTLGIGGSPIIIPAGATITLTLALDPAIPAAGSGPGADARAAHDTLPASVTIAFTPAGATLTAAGDASVTVFGATAHLTFQATAPVYNALLGRVAFPFACDATAITVASSLSAMCGVLGSAPVSSASWSIAATLSSGADLGSAAGAGGVALSIGSGLSVQWKDRGLAVACGPTEIVVDGSNVVVASGGATAPNRAQTITLGTATTAGLLFPAPFPLRFISESAGIEALAVITPISATFDKPRTVNNERVRLDGPAVIVLAAVSAGMLLIVDAAAPNAQSTIESYAIKNLLIKASDPIALFLSGAYANGTLTSGTATLQFELRVLVPILPDPYAGNVAFDPRSKAGASAIGVLSMTLQWQKGGAPSIDVLLPTKATAAVAPAEASSAAPFRMLDLSTNVSQFGVAFSTASARIADLYLQVPGAEVEVMTLPAVQWEPVITADQSIPFPSPLTYADSGLPTTLAARSVTLVPIAPRPAIDALLAAYHGTPPSAVSMRFTLPFGIVANARFERARVITARSVIMAEVTPQFTQQNLTGGDQLSVRAQHGLVVTSESPSLPGNAEQLQNARASGVPTMTTVLSPIDGTFNNNFGPSALTPRIPVTRIDISGFGESTFSDWRNNSKEAATVCKAQFNVIVGRTAREVVQVYSVLYPYAVGVVRTITIERQNRGVVTRHDSGWQAVSDGVYAYPNTDLVTHPGLVRGVVNVTNIRDTGQTYSTSDGSELMAARFDCAVTMENAVAGSGPAGVPARDQLGYVQLTDLVHHGALAPDQYAELVAAVGPMGGPVDCIVDIGGTGQRMRVAHVGVGTGSGVGGPEFVMAAWGSPIMPGGGQWSFVVQPDGADAPQAIDSDLGVPVVRAGPATAPPPTTSPYRFADPSDALQPDSPASDYGVLHATGTQRVLFPRPKIEATGAHAITSVRAPVIADPYALGLSVGPFPRLDACIPFPDANYALAIDANGNLALQRSSPNFTTPPLKRVLVDGQTDRAIVYCADEHNTPSVVTLTIDTAAATPWSFSITNVSAASESDPFGEIARFVGDIVSAPGATTQLANGRYVFGGALAPAVTLINFLEHFGPLPPPSFAMTNSYALQVGVQFPFKDLLADLESQPAIVAFIKQFVVDLDAKFLWQTAFTGSSHWSFIAQLELTIRLPTTVPHLYAVGAAKLQFQSGTDGHAWTVQIGAGFGYFDRWLGADAYAYFVESFFLIAGSTSFGLGMDFLVKGDLDFEIVEASFSAEAKSAVVGVDCSGGHSTFSVSQLTVAIEITIAWFVDIEFQFQKQYTTNVDNGPCTLPDVV
jgi:hypothetical protein